MNSQKLLLSPIILTALSAVVIIGGITYYLGSRNDTPTSTAIIETLGTKTYINDDYGFRFDYPADFELSDNIQTKGDQADGNNSLHISKEDLSLTLWVNPAGHDVGPTEIFYPFAHNNGATTLGDREVRKTSPEDVFQAPKGSIRFIGDMNGMNFLFNGGGASNQKLEDQLKDIVSSLRPI